MILQGAGVSHGQFIVLVLAAVVAGGALGGLTARAPESTPQIEISRELIVFETHDCA